MRISKSSCYLVIAIVAIAFECVESFSYRADDDTSDGSCVCGFNKALLDQLEKIVYIGTTTATCNYKLPEINSVDNNENNKFDTLSTSAASNYDKENNNDNKTPTPLSSKEEDPKIDNSNNQQEDSTFIEPDSSNSNSGLVTSSQNGPSSTGSVGDTNENKPASAENDIIAKLTAEIHRLESMISRPSKHETSSTTTSTTTNSGSITSSSYQITGSTNNQHQQTINGGFLGGVLISPISQTTNANDNSEQGGEIKPGEMSVVIQSTVPNVVSNIFSNIHNLTVEAEKNPQQKPDNNGPAMLTSINGQSINVQGGSSDQITAIGEKLFLAWLEQQIETLHLTASMAVYIRKSAVNLFRRIVRQYVDRMQRVGGSIELNVQRATQLALNNTQNLTAFLLKHYLYYAGGLMRIIGEQVSRTGKQLDSTGETISHFEMNPFDIISKVMDTLPNPSDYSKYFRDIGKQLIGDISSSWNSNKQNEQQQTEPSSMENGAETNQANQQEQQNQSPKPPENTSGLFKKTMSSLGKTLNSWMG